MHYVESDQCDWCGADLAETTKHACGGLIACGACNRRAQRFNLLMNADPGMYLSALVDDGLETVEDHLHGREGPRRAPCRRPLLTGGWNGATVALNDQKAARGYLQETGKQHGGWKAPRKTKVPSTKAAAKVAGDPLEAVAAAVAAQGRANARLITAIRSAMDSGASGAACARQLGITRQGLHKMMARS